MAGELAKLLEDLLQVCGDERRVAVGREITKLRDRIVVFDKVGSLPRIATSQSGVRQARPNAAATTSA